MSPAVAAAYGAFEALIALILIACAIYGFRIQRRLARRQAPTRNHAGAVLGAGELVLKQWVATGSPPAAEVDAVADLLEVKAQIRRDELHQWAEAWRRAGDLPDFGSAVREIREVEYVAVRDQRERQHAAAEQARRLAIETRQAEQTAALDAERAARAEAAAAAAAHEARLARRRARYAEQRRNQ